MRWGDTKALSTFADFSAAPQGRVAQLSSGPLLTQMIG